MFSSIAQTIDYYTSRGGRAAAQAVDSKQVEVSTVAASKEVPQSRPTIPLTMSDAMGNKLYVLENEAFHKGRASEQESGKKRSNKRDKAAGRLPELTPSLADFSVVAAECEKRKPKREEEWVMVSPKKPTKATAASSSV